MRQRTLLDLFPVKKARKGSDNAADSSPPEVQATAEQSSPGVRASDTFSIDFQHDAEGQPIPGVSESGPNNASDSTMLEVEASMNVGNGGDPTFEVQPVTTENGQGNQSDMEHDVFSEGITSAPPSSPVVISEAPSTPGSHPIRMNDGESDPALSDTEIQCLSPGGSQKDPIVVDSSPPKVRERRERPKKLWSIFAPRLPEPPGPTKCPSKICCIAPFPGADEQHVRGTQTVFSSKSAFCRHRSPKNDGCDRSEYQGGMQILLGGEPLFDRPILEFSVRPCCTESDKATCRSMIPEEHKKCHPAIERAVSTDRPISSPQLWADEWRPRRAAEVLGNERSALYLRDWLRALALSMVEGAPPEMNQDSKHKGKGTSKEARGLKRPRIVRVVDKKQRKKRRIESEDEDDSWIVYDDVSEEEAIPERDDNTDDNIETPSIGDLYTFEQLTNTIILTGPPGCGKTACVYACAEELNWDVFEVYPGIGKRNGASIENMIGEVGKNHLVKKATRVETRTVEESPECDRDFGFLESSSSDLADSSTFTPRQSLVLLEEVDILFKDDANFWPTIVNFLKDCRRPVICTCNDITLIPTLNLPLQNVLAFNPCPSPIAVSYLQAVCCNQGWSIDQESLTRLYEMPYEYATDGNEECPQLSAPDLRRTMHRIQLWCSTSHDNYMVHEPGAACSPCLDLIDEDPGSFKIMAAQMEALSCLDKSQFRTSFEGSIPSADDEVGHIILYDDGSRDGYADRSTMNLMTSTARQLARGTLDAWTARGVEGLFRTHVEYRKCLMKFVPLSAAGFGRREMYMEYAPYIRQMILAEDIEEKKWTETREGQSGRKTRNSNRYERVIPVSLDERRRLGIGSRELAMFVHNIS